MIDRQTFAWLLHSLNKGRRGLTQAGLDTDYGRLYPPQSALRFAGGVTLLTTYGNIHQFTAVSEKCLFDNVTGEIGTADSEGRTAFRNFIHPDSDSGNVGVSVIMDGTIRQTDPVFKGIIQSFHYGTLKKKQTDIILKRCLRQLPTQE
jgi:hypothetical protein